MVLAVALIVIQLALIGRDAVLVAHAAREGARSAAVDSTRAEAVEGAKEASGGLDHQRMNVQLREDDRWVTVTVSYSAPTRLPLIGALVPDPELRSTVRMLREDG